MPEYKVVYIGVPQRYWGTLLQSAPKGFSVKLLSREAGVDEMKAYPYAKTIQRADENGVLQDVVTNRSTYRVDLDFFLGSPGLDPEDITNEPCGPTTKTGDDADHLVKADLIFDDSDRI